MTNLPGLREKWAVSCLVPDLPLTADLLPYLEAIDRNRWYTNFGPLQHEFEDSLARYLADDNDQRPGVVSVSSATLGLELSLQAMELKPGARILLPSLTFAASILAILHCGHTPVLADVDAHSWGLLPDYAKLAAAKTGIDAVLAVAPFGYPLAIDAWEKFRQETGIAVLVDAAGALGTQQVSPVVPVIFSLHATKPLGAGEGGVLVSSDEALVHRVRQLSNFGFGEGGIEYAGTNAKLSEYHAAVGLAQLQRAAAVLKKRKWILEQYRKLLPPVLFNPAAAENVPPAVLPLHLQGHADDFALRLAERQIETRRWYYPLLHQHRIFSAVETCNPLSKDTFAIADYLGRSLVGIPFHSHLGEKDISLVAESVLAALPAGI